MLTNGQSDGLFGRIWKEYGLKVIIRIKWIFDRKGKWVMAASLVGLWLGSPELSGGMLEGN